MTTKTSSRWLVARASGTRAGAVVVAVSELASLLEKYAYLDALGLNTKYSYKVSGEAKGVAKVNGEFYEVFFTPSSVVSLYVKASSGTVSVEVAKARALGRDTNVLIVKYGVLEFYMPPRSLEDALFFVLNRHLLDEIAGLQRTESQHPALFYEILSRLNKNKGLCKQLLNQMALHGKKKLTEAVYTDFEIELNLPVLVSVGVTPVFYDLDDLAKRDVLYFAWVRIGGKLEKLFSREPSGLATILDLTVPNGELGRATRELTKVVNAILVSPAALSAYWEALSSL